MNRFARNFLFVGAGACALMMVVFLAVPARAETPAEQPAGPVYQHGVVAADHPLASRAGLEMLEKGGNVVDAAVATSFALSVVRPSSCGIGGGGFMVIWNAKTQKSVALDYREKAPAAASREMYVKARKKNPDNPYPSRDGALAVAVPGNVAGLCHALEKYGTFDLSTVLAPAIRYCKEGIPVDAHSRDIQREVLDDFEKHPRMRTQFAALYKLYLNEGKPWPENARFYSPLGPVLERIAKQGPAGFYEGEVAEAIAGSLQKAGGIITKQDLKNMAPKERNVLRGEYRGRTILTMPPPSSGGTALLEILNILTAWTAEHPAQAQAIAAQPSRVSPVVDRGDEARLRGPGGVFGRQRLRGCARSRR